MSTTPQSTPMTMAEIEAMPFDDLMRQAKTIVRNSACTMSHHTDMMMILDEIDARVKSRP